MTYKIVFTEKKQREILETVGEKMWNCRIDYGTQKTTTVNCKNRKKFLKDEHTAKKLLTIYLRVSEQNNFLSKLGLL